LGSDERVILGEIGEYLGEPLRSNVGDTEGVEAVDDTVDSDSSPLSVFSVSILLVYLVE
jgi:hypothetical protein